MDNNERENAPILLPMAMAEHGNARFYFDQAALGWREVDSAWEKECRQSLYMSSAQKTAWTKGTVTLRPQRQSLAHLNWSGSVVWFTLHEPILVNYRFLLTRKLELSRYAGFSEAP
jgi:hypothetical protein